MSSVGAAAGAASAVGTGVEPSNELSELMFLLPAAPITPAAPAASHAATAAASTAADDMMMMAF